MRHPLAATLAGGLVLRLLLATLPGFPTDIGFFEFWARQIASNGPEDFYAPGEFHDYPPGYMWVLWLFGDIDETVRFSEGQWEYLLKLPAIIADLGSAYLLYLFLRGRTVAPPIGAAALYLVFPPTLLIGAVWGQVDSILAFFVFLTIYLLDRGRPVAASVAFTVGFLVKPQAIAALPFLIFWFVREHPPSWRRVGDSLRLPLPPRLWPTMIGSSLGAAVVIAFPFFPSLLLWRPLVDLVSQVRKSASEIVPLNSFFAYNFWELLDIAPRCDVAACAGVPAGTDFLGLTTRTWGYVLFAVAVVSVLVVLRKARGPAFLALGTSLCMLSFFVFATRMHERYLFPFFLPFLAACALLGSRVLWTAFGLLATVNTLNMYYVYTNHPDGQPLRVQALYDWLGDRHLGGTDLATGQLLSFIVVATVPALVFEAHRLARRGSYHRPDG